MSRARLLLWAGGPVFEVTLILPFHHLLDLCQFLIGNFQVCLQTSKRRLWTEALPCRVEQAVIEIAQRERSDPEIGSHNERAVGLLDFMAAIQIFASERYRLFSR